MRGKMKDYFGSIWNKFDFTMYVLALATFVMRNFHSTFWVSVPRQSFIITILFFNGTEMRTYEFEHLSFSG